MPLENPRINKANRILTVKTDSHGNCFTRIFSCQFGLLEDFLASAKLQSCVLPQLITSSGTKTPHTSEEYSPNNSQEGARSQELRSSPAPPSRSGCSHLDPLSSRGIPALSRNLPSRLFFCPHRQPRKREPRKDRSQHLHPHKREFLPSCAAKGYQAHKR